MFRAFIELCRISNLPTVWTNITAAWLIASNGPKWRPELFWLLVGASLIYSAGMILNDAFDAAWDREKRPERPIPSGRISLSTAWLAGIGGLMGGYAIMVWPGGADWRVIAALVGAVLLYDAYHKPWAGSVIVMGACRALLYASAVWPAMMARTAQKEFFCGAGLAPEVYAKGLILGIYVVALTLIARAEGRGNVNETVRRGLTAALLLPALEGLAFPLGSMSSPAVLLVTTAAFVGWTWHALVQMRKGGPFIGAAVGLLLAGIPLVDAITVACVSQPLALAFCSLPPLLRLWQRWVAAT